MDEMRVRHGLENWTLLSTRGREKVQQASRSQPCAHANVCVQWDIRRVQNMRIVGSVHASNLSNSARARQHHHCMSSLGPTANSSAAQTHSTVRCVPILCAEKLLDSTTCSYGKGNARETKLASFCFEIECIVACVDMPKKKHVGFIN
jgi:hypothetical protein